MAISLLGSSGQRYLGLSTDVKPIAADGVSKGATFYTTDTRQLYTFDGREWIEGYDPAAETNQLLAALLTVQQQALTELEIIRQALTN